MKIIKLSRDMKMMVDDEDFETLSRFRWSWSKSRSTHYATADIGERKRVLAHRLILGFPPKNVYVDHIDMNGLNNQKSNLRKCTRNQNCQYARKRKDNTSGYRGVNFHRGYYIARIRVNCKRYYIGNFKTAEEAARAYDREAKKHHKQFASLNFKEGRS